VTVQVLPAVGDPATQTSAEAIMVRDTTDRDGGTLAFTADAWQRLIFTIR
jgi:hypothetical protein